MVFPTLWHLIDVIAVSRRSQALTTKQRQGLLTASWVHHRITGLVRRAAQMALMFVALAIISATIYAAALLVGLTPVQALRLLLLGDAVLVGVLVLFIVVCARHLEAQTLLARRRIPRPYYDATNVVIDRPYRGPASGVYTALVNEALARGRNHRVIAHPANERLAARYRELGFVEVPDSGNPPLMIREPDPPPFPTLWASTTPTSQPPTARSRHPCGSSSLPGPPSPS